MVHLYSSSRKKLFLSLLVQCVLVLGFVVQGYGQTAIFPKGVETLGTSSAASAGSYSGYTNQGVMNFSGNAEIINTTTANSSGYSGASGDSHVKLIAGTSFTISNINTSKYNNINLYFGLKRTATRGGTLITSDLLVEYSIDGTSWKPLSYGEIPTTTTWGLKTVSGVPAAEALSIRFTRSITTGSDFRIDDINLTGAIPQITGFSPQQGGVGTSITITGVSLGEIVEAYFYPSFTPLNIISASDTEVVVEVIEVNSEPAQIVLYNTANDEFISNDYFTFIAPSITSISPIAGTVGTLISISGDNLLGTYEVAFAGGVTVAPKSTSNNVVEVVVPVGAQTGPVEVRTDIGSTSSPEVFTIYEPAITQISPTSGGEGVTVTINGTRLAAGGTETPTVTFTGGVKAVVTSSTDTQLKVTVPVGAQTGPITVTTSEGTAQSTAFTVTKPTLTIVADLQPFKSSLNQPSAAQSYTISGQYLASNIQVAAPANFQVSLAQTSGFGTSVIVPVSSQGTATSVAVWVRYNPTTSGTHSGNITNSATGATTQSVAVSGTVPTISVTSNFTDFMANAGATSTSQSYTVSGTNLNGAITITAPIAQSFQVSLDNTTFGSSVVIPLASGSTTISATTVYVRYSPTDSELHSGDIAHTSSGATTIYKTVNGQPNTGTLPVELVAFDVQQSNGGTLLTWSTASEKNNAYFDIEMAGATNEDFKKVGSVNSKAGNSSVLTTYSFTDHSPVQGTRYYRLKQVDVDGTYTYSKVVAVTGATNTKQHIVVAPNPLNYNSKIFFTATNTGKAVLRLYTTAGAQVYFKSVDVHSGHNEVQLPLYDQLQPGVYVLSVELDGTRQQVRVVKR
ncbi:T9SS type A sorting domain-containing protein [Pontibacter chitinilyticus]|uniref:T9SS type A sorting domain-containing protein n=1 Tax=Pontibacter chitinilyticus TaxID=2674989 RepID=UPI00321C387F